MEVIIDTPDESNLRKYIHERFDKFIDTVNVKMIERLQYLGELCVKHAREIPAAQGFTDRTGNLRSSIGYTVFMNGNAVHEGYEVTGQGNEGEQKGKELARRVAREHPKGILLVVTAGMGYALALESKGRDVLTSAEQLAAKELPQMLDKLKRNINQALK